MQKVKVTRVYTETLKEGQDVFCVSVPSGKVLLVGDKQNYTIGQTINFGLNYGRTAYGLAHGLGITVEESQKFIDSYFANFGKVKTFMDKAINTVVKNKYVQTLVKRRRRFDNYNRIPVPKGVKYEDLPSDQKRKLQAEKDKNNKAIERMATNAIIQGSASDIMKIAMRNMYNKLKPYYAYILLQIHDEVLVECPIKDQDIVMKIVREEMENAVKLPGVPLVAEPKVTEEWEK